MPLKPKTEPKYYSLGSKDDFHKKKVSTLAEIWECPQTGAKSLHASTEILPGNIISQLGSRDFVETPTYLSVQVDSDKHILLDPLHLQYINHSCDPNVFFDTTNGAAVCLKKIDTGEAMTFFYPSTEWSMTQSFDCLCGSEQCLGSIQGAKYLPVDVLENYKLSEHIQKML